MPLTAIVLLIAAALIFAAFISVAYRRRWTWTGFPASSGGRSDTGHPAKTLWDWLELLLVPVALAVVAVLLNQWQTNREKDREEKRADAARLAAEDNVRQETLQAYLGSMSDLMLERDLLVTQGHEAVRSVARTITLTALRRLDGERKGLIVRFLSEAGLIAASNPRVRLDNADLRGVKLRDAILDQISLEGADLRRSDLRGISLSYSTLINVKLQDAKLDRATLLRACIDHARFDRASLYEGNLQGMNGIYARFPGADLRTAYLSEAWGYYIDFTGADLRGAQLDASGKFAPARLYEVDLHGARLQGAGLPTDWGQSGIPTPAEDRNEPLPNCDERRRRAP
jgi:uncharacterized protein YjbI with pentapeptide repeats